MVHPDVRKALRERRPVVALESTIISQGMPYPQNLRTAQEVEEVVRQGSFLQSMSNHSIPLAVCPLWGVGKTLASIQDHECMCHTCG